MRTYQVYNFWTMSAMESQNAAEDSQNKENMTRMGLMCYKKI